MKLCAFPGSGKTRMVRYLAQFASSLRCPALGADIDYGKVRDMYSCSFSAETDRGENFISLFYKSVVEEADKRGVCFVLTNEPRIHYDDVVFIIPSFSREEWLRRIEERGDNLSFDWSLYIYTHWEDCIQNWTQIAHKAGYPIFHLHEKEYLTDLIPCLTEFEEQRNPGFRAKIESRGLSIRCSSNQCSRYLAG